jgi:hypothetical protein
MMQTRYSISPGYGISLSGTSYPVKGKRLVKVVMVYSINYQVNKRITGIKQ